MTDQHTTSRSPEPRTADEIQPKQCEWCDDMSGERCQNDAEKTTFRRVETRVNTHGVHIATKVCPVFVCTDHDHYPEVPPAGATVVSNPHTTGGRQ